MSENLPTTAANAALAEIAGFEDLATDLAHAEADLPTTAGGDPYLRLGRDGLWIYGANDIEVQEGSLWVIDPRTLLRGFTCWTDYQKGHPNFGQKNKNLGEVMYPLKANRTDKDKLPVHLDEHSGQPWDWNDQMSVELTCISGEDKGQKVLYKTSSVGGLKLLRAYFDEVKKQVKSGKVIAVVTLESDFYDHKAYGKTFTPEFGYADWRLPTDIVPVEGGEPAAQEDTGSREPDQAQEKQEAAPSRGRRRPAADETTTEAADTPARGRRRPAA